MIGFSGGRRKGIGVKRGDTVRNVILYLYVNENFFILRFFN